MKSNILTLCIVLLFSLLILCSCNKADIKSETSIMTTFKVEGAEIAKDIVITAKEKETGKHIKIKLTAEKETLQEVEPGVYIISKVSENDKRISLSLKEQYFTVNPNHRVIEFAIQNEYQKTALEWFLYNNSLHLTCLVGCAIFLGVYKHRKEKKLSMR